MIAVTVASAWLVCGLLGAGLLFAHFQGEEPERADNDRALHYELSLPAVVFGPIGLMFALFEIERGSSSHGWRLW